MPSLVNNYINTLTVYQNNLVKKLEVCRSHKNVDSGKRYKLNKQLVCTENLVFPQGNAILLSTKAKISANSVRVI